MRGGGNLVRSVKISRVFLGFGILRWWFREDANSVWILSVILSVKSFRSNIFTAICTIGSFSKHDSCICVNWDISVVFPAICLFVSRCSQDS